MESNLSKLAEEMAEMSQKYGKTLIATSSPIDTGVLFSCDVMVEPGDKKPRILKDRF